MKRVLRFGILEELSLMIDKDGEFIPVCMYEKHPGVVKKSIYYSCVERNCRHLKRYRSDEFVLRVE